MGDRQINTIFVDDESSSSGFLDTKGFEVGTINLEDLIEQEVSDSGTFDFRGIHATSFGQLLQAIPIPALLIDQARNIAFANRAWRNISSKYEHIQGKPLTCLFPHGEHAVQACTLLEEAFLTSRQQAVEALLKVNGTRVWGRINFRAIRIGVHKLMLLLIEDLTLARKQLILNREQRTKLVEANARLRREVEQRRSAEEELKRSFHRLETVLEQTGTALAAAAEKRDPYIAGHQRRVAKLGSLIADQMRLSEDTIRCVWVSGTLHDIGKLCVPAEILSKPGDLTGPERDLIKAHPTAGYDILKGIEFHWPVAEIVHQHHERLDGTGYPNGLEGGEILLEARILAVADVFEAMSFHRPYRPAIGRVKALQELEEFKGRLYDDDAVDALTALLNTGFELE